MYEYYISTNNCCNNYSILKMKYVEIFIYKVLDNFSVWCSERDGLEDGLSGGSKELI